ncbi:hypothetical protein PUN28_017814 [Cardiocondyla obscurior]|uniref:Uncharacterized protein n=1 Tax=Cardiocondyla obscurior TaxID=286306 RepID=A0AAW2EPJ4_9HYME
MKMKSVSVENLGNILNKWLTQRSKIPTIIGAKNGEKTCLKVSEDEKYINNDSNLPNRCNRNLKLFKPVKRRLSFESWKKEKVLRTEIIERNGRKQQELIKIYKFKLSQHLLSWHEMSQTKPICRKINERLITNDHV